ncbi:MAG: sulfite exporter TauE/SafE family protein [Xanthobacteraceae bacterium]|jgi:uncharacterized membrane protein YfcA
MDASLDTSLDASLGLNTFTFLFLVGTFFAALVAGLGGFAFGIVAAAVWLYILSPLHTATLIMGLGLVVQGYSVWTLRHALSWSRLAPLLIGTTFGVPLGVFALAHADPHYLRLGIGAVLVLFSLYGLLRPAIAPVKAAAPADLGVGFCNGVLGGATGLAGIIVVIWSQLRGWAKDQQRAVFQPVGVATFAMSAAWLGGQGSISPDVVRLFVVALPVLLAGTWLGLKFYGKLNEIQFRRLVLVLLLVSGAVLLFR